MELNSEYKREKRGFRGNGQSEGVGEKLVKRNWLDIKSGRILTKLANPGLGGHRKDLVKSWAQRHQVKVWPRSWSNPTSVLPLLRHKEYVKHSTVHPHCQQILMKHFCWAPGYSGVGRQTWSLFLWSYMVWREGRHKLGIAWLGKHRDMGSPGISSRNT